MKQSLSLSKRGEGRRKDGSAYSHPSPGKDFPFPSSKKKGERGGSGIIFDAKEKKKIFCSSDAEEHLPASGGKEDIKRWEGREKERKRRFPS